MRKVLFSLLIVTIMVLTSCSVGAGSVTTYRNNEVDKTTLDSIKALDDKVLNSIKSNDASGIIEISSEAFKNDSGNLNELVGKINEIVKDKSFDYKDRYYCKVNKIGKYSFTIATFQDDPFTITLDAMSKDIFVSLIKSNSNINDYLLTLIYIKEQNDWKLRTLYVGDYSYNGMTAIDLYEKAKVFDTKGYKIPAALYSGLSNKFLRPAPFLQYKKESEITDFSKKVVDGLKDSYVFPQKLKSINNVEIYGFDVKCLDEGIVPVIKYTTSISIDNEKEIEKEANDINQEVTNLYTGMKENFKIFLYEAYFEPPVDPKTNYKCYRTIVDQK